jgi:hypothetical protein
MKPCPTRPAHHVGINAVNPALAGLAPQHHRRLTQLERSTHDELGETQDYLTGFTRSLLCALTQTMASPPFPNLQSQTQSCLKIPHGNIRSFTNPEKSNNLFLGRKTRVVRTSRKNAVGPRIVHGPFFLVFCGASGPEQPLCPSLTPSSQHTPPHKGPRAQRC